MGAQELVHPVRGQEVPRGAAVLIARQLLPGGVSACKRGTGQRGSMPDGQMDESCMPTQAVLVVNRSQERPDS